MFLSEQRNVKFKTPTDEPRMNAHSDRKLRDASNCYRTGLERMKCNTCIRDRMGQRQESLNLLEGTKTRISVCAHI